MEISPYEEKGVCGAEVLYGDSRTLLTTFIGPKIDPEFIMYIYKLIEDRRFHSAFVYYIGDKKDADEIIKDRQLDLDYKTNLVSLFPITDRQLEFLIIMKKAKDESYFDVEEVLNIKERDRLAEDLLSYLRLKDVLNLFLDEIREEGILLDEINFDRIEKNREILYAFTLLEEGNEEDIKEKGSELKEILAVGPTVEDYSIYIDTKLDALRVHYLLKHEKKNGEFYYYLVIPRSLERIVEKLLIKRRASLEELKMMANFLLIKWGDTTFNDWLQFLERFNILESSHGMYRIKNVDQIRTLAREATRSLRMIKSTQKGAYKIRAPLNAYMANERGYDLLSDKGYKYVQCALKKFKEYRKRKQFIQQGILLKLVEEIRDRAKKIKEDAEAERKKAWEALKKAYNTKKGIEGLLSLSLPK